MTALTDVRQDLVAANRMLAHEGILDAYGHVSVRHPEHPDRYLLSRARAPELIEDADLIEFTLDGTPLREDPPPMYLERFIHGALYEARPDVMAVCHNHTPSILPFSIAKRVRLQSVIHSASFLGLSVPVWDIAEEFGTETNLLVQSMEQGHSLARVLGDQRVALMRGHGSVVVGGDLEQAVSNAINMEKNARVQLQALQLDEIIPLHPGEVAFRRVEGRPDRRAWEYWKRRAGC